MEIPKKPRYPLATLCALETTKYLGVNSYPLNLKEIIKAEGIKLKKYSTLAKKTGLTIDEVSKNLGSQLGLLVRHEDGKYVLNYNDAQTNYLVTFTLAHELGHYALGHLEDFAVTELCYRGLEETVYEVLEKEANCFARNILSPAPVADLFKEKNTHDLMEFFGIGFQAAETRLNLLSTDIYNARRVITNATKFFFKKLRDKIKNRYHCEICGSITIGADTAYCSVCRHNNLVHITPDGYHLHKDFGGEIVKYSGFKVNEEGMAYTCPICENEEFIDDSEICQICGNSRRNICLGFIQEYLDYSGNKIHAKEHEKSGCGTILSGNSRYCHKCAGISSFYYQGMLKDWTLEKQQDNIENVS